MTKQRACILGATGAAGQNIVESLMDHPWFQIDTLAASKKSTGKSYKDAIEDAVFFEKMPGNHILNMIVHNVEEIDPRDYDLAFSALPSGVARKVEARFAEHIPVFSTASAYRYEQDVPVLIPDVNPEHIALIDVQRRNRGWKGYIIPGPNCTTVGLVATLKPVKDAYGLKRVRMISMQSLSGAGEKGIRVDSPYRAKVEMNVYPFIEGEEEKVIKETNKILGKVVNDEIIDAGIGIHATCTRVFVEKVHTEIVDIETETSASLEDIKAVLVMYESDPQKLGLPSSPERPLLVFDEIDMPQPKLHREHGFMVTQVGRIQKNNTTENSFTYILTSDNLEKGAGTGAVNAAEYLKVQGYL
jgi:aspartate-semialdehyde dehydrogenase